MNFERALAVECLFYIRGLHGYEPKMVRMLILFEIEERAKKSKKKIATTLAHRDDDTAKILILFIL